MTMNAKRIKFLMDIDESFDKLSKDHPEDPSITKLQDKFYNLANNQFVRSAYQGLHELTVEDGLKNQAEEFYKNFPQNIKDELAESFIEMEHQRRRDNYFEFCFSIYKQVECVVNYLINLNNGELFQNLLNIRNQKVFSSNEHYYDTVKRAITNRTNRQYLYGFKVQNKILAYWNAKTQKYYTDSDYDTEYVTSVNQIYINKRDFIVKFRVVLYMVFFSKQVEKELFESIEELFYEIQQIRNVGHGGKISGILEKQSNNQSLDKQEGILMNSFYNRYNNYLRYQGFLADFMKKCQKHA